MKNGLKTTIINIIIKKQMAKKQMTFLITEEVQTKLKAKSNETGLTMTTIILLSLQSWMKDN